jgi:hypothetical protein
LFASITTIEAGERFFDASMMLKRRTLDRRSMRWTLMRFPWMTARIVVAIYYQALRLWMKKCPFFPHPNKLDATSDQQKSPADKTSV